MATPVLMTPGVRTQGSALLNSTSYVVSNLIRFREANGQGYAAIEKYGGWGKFSTTPLNGKGRGLLANSLLDGTPYLVAGTEKQLEVFTTDGVYDITPLRKQTNLTNPFTTIIGTKPVTVHDVAHGAGAGNGVFVQNYTAIGGVIIQGWYLIQSVTDADNYVINLPSNAISGAAGGGTTTSFTTIDASPLITATLVKHGLIAGNTYAVNVATVIAGLTLYGPYTVIAAPTADTFTFDAASNAVGVHTVSENAGNVNIHYLIPSGSADAEQAQGFGLGGFGEGDFGFGEPSAGFLPPRRWHIAKFGEDAVVNYTNGPLFFFDAATGFQNNPAIIIDEAPQQAIKIFTTMPQRQIFALGAEDNGAQNPLLIKWCDIQDQTNWLNIGDIPDPNSQAGWFPITSGSRLVGGMQVPGKLLVWTDIGMWMCAYEGPPYVYGFLEVEQGCGLIGVAAAGAIGGVVFWMSNLGIFMYDGSSVQQIPCDVWDKFFKVADFAQAEKIVCCVNEDFTEIMWQGQSIGGTENDTYIKLNTKFRAWDYGPPGTQLARTDWIDKSIWGAPIGVGSDSYIYQHETGTDADTAAMDNYAESGYFSLNDGEDFLFVERFMPDFVFTGGGTVNITFYMKEFATEDGPQNPLYAYGPFPITAQTNFCIVRGRNRFAKFRLESNDLGSFWRQGKPTYFGSATGKR